MLPERTAARNAAPLLAFSACVPRCVPCHAAWPATQNPRCFNALLVSLTLLRERPQQPALGDARAR